ncbi:MAG TPA: hypothetical protein PLV74_09560 [Bacteroidales bacterium]|jgi:hypothetical protein|nr:hypothetical protein [Bacteroidales bacterium]
MIFFRKIFGCPKLAWLVFLIFTFFIYYGCKKEPQPPDSPEKVPFRVGMTQPLSMNIYHLNKTIGNTWGVNSKYLYNLDFNKDGWDDFALYAWADYSPGGIKTNESKIIIVNNKISLIGQDNIDTVKSCTFLNNDSLQQTIEYNTLSGYKCENGIQRIRRIDTVFTSFFFSQGDTIEGHAFSGLSEFFLSSRTESINYLIWEGNVFIEFFKIDQHFGLIDHEPKYLVFKMTEGNSVKLGWIKLETIESSKIILHEVVIEK